MKELFTERARWKELSSIWWIENVSLVDFSTIRVYLEELSRKLVAFQRKLEPNEALHLFRADVDTFKPLFYAV